MINWTKEKNLYTLNECEKFTVKERWMKHTLWGMVEPINQILEISNQWV